jgi:hypothetical protein
MSTKLDHIDKKLPYDAPYAYFENFENRLKGRLESEAPQPLIWWQQARWKLAMAAVVMITAAWFFNSQLNNELTLAEISAEDKVEYLYTHTDAYFSLLAGDEELALEMENVWMTPEEAEAYLEEENLEILMTEL